MESINWGDGYNYGNGITPSVAMNDHGVIVEVHRGDGLTSKMWHQVGVRGDGNTIEWGESVNYDTGKGPRIALNNNGVIVEVHQSDILHHIWYRVGTVDAKAKSITWGQSQKYDNGTTPDIAINDRGAVIEVHHAGNSDLWYHTGTVDPDKKKVSFNTSIKYDKGDHPSIALNNEGKVVELHETYSGTSLWYNVGHIEDGSISFPAKAKHYDEGYNPFIAINDCNAFVAMHKSNSSNTLWFHQGVITDGQDIIFGSSNSYANGTSPTVAFNNKQQLVEVHVENITHRWYLSTDMVKQNLTGNLSWMSDNYEVLKTKPLSQITLPGTHDTGTYDLTNIPAKGDESPLIEFLEEHAPSPFLLDIFKDFSIAQHRNVGDQLKGGIRFLDLRIIEYESEFYIHHGVLGPKIPLILEDIFNFLSDDKVTHELVIVAASNMRQMEDNSHAKFMDLVENTLGKFLFQNGGNYESLLHTTRLQDIVDQGPKILFIYDDKYLDKHPNPSFFPKEVVYSHWSNTTSMKDLIKDQEKQLKDHSSRSDSLFELQWLFTTQVANGAKDVLDRLDVVEDKFIHTLHSLSHTPGMWIGDFLKNNTQHQINIVIVDFFEETDVVELCIKRSINQ